MKIAIDVSQVVYGTGVSRYTQNLVSNLLKIDDEDQYILFGGALRRMYDLRKYFYGIAEPNARKVLMPVSPRMADFIWNRVHRLHIEKLVGKVDVFHSSDWTQPPSRAFNITTVHDLAPIKFPQLTPTRVIETHRQRLEWVKKEVDRIIVPSETTKKDLMDLGFEEEKIRFIPEAAEELYKPVDTVTLELAKNKFGIRQNYLLAVGINARKNTQRILEAFKKLRKDIPLELVVVGNRTLEMKTNIHVKIVGHVEENDMRALYTGASALVYPSLYEGFGLPILESFACKTPVVTSNIGAMAEVGRDAAVLVDPESIESIVKGVRKVLTNRNDYVIKGMKRVKKYSWKKTAEETLKVYQEALKN